MSTLSTVLLCIGGAIAPLLCFWLGFEQGARHSTKIWTERWRGMEGLACYWCERALRLRLKLDALEQKRHDEGEEWKKD